MNVNWPSTELALRDSLTDIPWGGFIIVEYDRLALGEDCPFSQGAPGPGGWYAEVVSDIYLPGDVWPIDNEWLASSPWLPPDNYTLNWWSSHLSTEEVAGHLLAGLAQGRHCTDPLLITARTGTFPSGPRGGQPANLSPTAVALVA